MIVNEAIVEKASLTKDKFKDIASVYNKITARNIVRRLMNDEVVAVKVTTNDITDEIVLTNIEND